jgi:hypothetical protein
MCIEVSLHEQAGCVEVYCLCELMALGPFRELITEARASLLLRRCQSLPESQASPLTQCLPLEPTGSTELVLARTVGRPV